MNATMILKAIALWAFTGCMIILILVLQGCILPLDYFADQMIYPERQQLPKTPANYNFRTPDPVKMG